VRQPITTNDDTDEQGNCQKKRATADGENSLSRLLPSLRDWLICRNATMCC